LKTLQLLSRKLKREDLVRVKRRQLLLVKTKFLKNKRKLLKPLLLLSKLNKRKNKRNNKKEKELKKREKRKLLTKLKKKLRDKRRKRKAQKNNKPE